MRHLVNDDAFRQVLHQLADILPSHQMDIRGH